MLQLEEQRVVSTALEGSASTADEAAFLPTSPLCCTSDATGSEMPP